MSFKTSDIHIISGISEKYGKEMHITGSREMKRKHIRNFHAD
jgi:hypothetical protein